MPVRVVEPHPRIDALPDSLALERGPVVYCFEAIDQPGVNLNAVRLDPANPIKSVAWPDRLSGIVALQMQGWLPRHEH